MVAGVAGSALAAALAWSVLRPDRVLRIGAGLAAHAACSTVFVSGLAAEPATSEILRNGLGFGARLVRYRVDRSEGSATAAFPGLAPRRASFVPGFGCRLDYPGQASLGSAAAAHPGAPAAPAGAPPDPGPALAAAIDRVFTQRPGRPSKAVRAVVVVRDGQVIAERYAPGVGADTPLPSWSVAKSLTNAILGILVRQGRLRINQPAGAAEWSDPHDPRNAITVEDLLRMRSGIDAHEGGSPFDPVARMLFAEPDMAAYAAGRPLKAPAGVQWEYSSANTLILDRLLGQSVGGGAAGLRAFVARELLAPLGITSLTMEFDGAGTFIGSTFVYASARDYARLGQLYLDDGVAPGGVRILPEGWVEWSRHSTLGAGYGAGFWTNDGDGPQARARIAAGFPADGFYASGVFGQRIYIVPSARLVIARLGNSAPPDFGMDDDLALIAAAGSH